jgi:hypothetical protein
MNKETKRLSMETFNRICLDCGLVPNEAKNKEYNNEASYFNLVHPISKEPIEVAYYEDFIDDDYSTIHVGAHIRSILGYHFSIIDTTRLGIDEEYISQSIGKLKHFLDEELEARKKTKVPLKEFIDFIAPQRELVRNGLVELSVPVSEFITKLGTNPVLKIDVTKE